MLYHCYYDTNKKLGKREKLVYLISFKFRQICLFFNKATLPCFDFAAIQKKQPALLYYNNIKQILFGSAKQQKSDYTKPQQATHNHA